MMNYQPGELFLVAFPYTSGAQTKKRAALVILDTGDDDVLVARVTAQPQTTVFDVRLANWRRAGLLLPSTVRLHKLATIEKTTIVRRLGVMKAGDRRQVSSVLQKAFGNW
jgi:mRNA interferase MazF